MNVAVALRLLCYHGRWLLGKRFLYLNLCLSYILHLLLLWYRLLSLLWRDSFESLRDSVVEHLSLISALPCVFILRVPLVNILNHLLRHLLLVELLDDFEIARLFSAQLFYRRHRDDPLVD